MGIKKVLYTPGPTNVPEFVRHELSLDMIHHRMEDYKHILFQVTDKLKKVFQTKEDVFILTASGTGAMEASVVNLFSKGDTVLVINTGFFGDRYKEICTVYGLNVIELKYEWGTSYQLEDVKNTIQLHPEIKGVLMTHHETSTGVCNDVKSVGDLLQNTDLLFITDCISGMIVHPFEFDAWHVDCAVAASQKGFLLPPGLAFVSLSYKAKKQMESSDLPKYYWDFRKYRDFLAKGQNPFTPAIPLIIALDKALDYLLNKGLGGIIKEQVELREYAEKLFTHDLFDLFIKEKSLRGNVLVPVVPKFKMDIERLTKDLDQKYGFSVSKGQGAYTNQMLRIGIIGELNKKNIEQLIDKMTVLLKSYQE